MIYLLGKWRLQVPNYYCITVNFSFMSINICPVCRYHSVLLVPYSVQVCVGVPHVWVHTVLCCTHWLSLACTRCGTLLILLDLVPGGVAKDVLQGPAGWPESLGRTLPITQGKGNGNNGAHFFLWFWIVLQLRDLYLIFFCHVSTLGYLPPEERGRGVLTLNIPVDLTLGLAQSFINIWCYLMPPWIWKSWEMFFFFWYLPKFITLNNLLWF